MVTMTRLSPADAIAEIVASSAGPSVGAFFDLDGTLVDGFTAAVHLGERIRRRQAGIGEVLGAFDAALRYRFGRLEFEHLIVRAASYLRGELLRDLDEVGERLFVERVAVRMYSHMRDIVEAHQQRGHTVRPIVWGTSKASAVQQFCIDNGVALQRSYFYADGDEDAAAMSVVGFPRPVNPRSGLAAAAAVHGWPVMCLASVRRRRPRRALRYLANHVRRDVRRDAD